MFQCGNVWLGTDAKTQIASVSVWPRVAGYRCEKADIVNI